MAIYVLIYTHNFRIKSPNWTTFFVLLIIVSVKSCTTTKCNIRTAYFTVSLTLALCNPRVTGTVGHELRFLSLHVSPKINKKKLQQGQTAALNSKLQSIYQSTAIIRLWRKPPLYCPNFRDPRLPSSSHCQLSSQGHQFSIQCMTSSDTLKTTL